MGTPVEHCGAKKAHAGHYYWRYRREVPHNYWCAGTTTTGRKIKGEYGDASSNKFCGEKVSHPPHRIAGAAFLEKCHGYGSGYRRG